MPAPRGKRPARRKLTRHPTASAVNAKLRPFHCRQDTVGSLLRALDLAPRCDLSEN
jgi:hypothetical protein